jgi:hypothetical protein
MTQNRGTHLERGAVKNSVLQTPSASSLTSLRQIGLPSSSLDPLREVELVARRSASELQDQADTENQERTVRLSVNLSAESAETFKTLIKRKGLTITEGIRRAIAVWKFVEDETQRGNQIAVIERDDSVRKVVLL